MTDTEADRIEQILKEFDYDCMETYRERLDLTPEQITNELNTNLAKALAAIHKELTKARIDELNRISQLDLEHIGDYTPDRIAHLKREAGGENE